MEKTTTTTTTCGNLPFLSEDILIRKVLVCLPVTSLLRFKSVSKSWRQLIQTPFFIDLHTTFNTCSSKFGDTTTFILQTREPSFENYEDDIKLYMLSSSSESGSDDHDHGEDEDDNDDNKDEADDQKKKRMVFKVKEDLRFLPFYKDYLLNDTLRMVGSCNGIICLHDPEVMNINRGCRKQQHYTSLRDVCLWNPATRHFRILPKSIPIQEKQDYIGTWLADFIGFGFDVKTKDYKVLRITPLFDYKSKEGRGCKCRVQVYSLSTDSWRLLEGINSLPVQPNQVMSLTSGIYLNGSYFFAEYVRSYTQSSCVCMLLSFDFTKEIFTTSIQLPSYLNNSSTIVSSYLGGGDKLAVFTKPRHLGVDDDDDGYEYYDIWVLNEQHDSSAVVNKESWTKLHSFRIKISRTSDSTKPICISNNGEFALISTGTTYVDGCSRNKLQLFNLITKEAIKDFTIGTRDECRAHVYKESLVSIMGGGGGGGGGGGNGNVLLRWQLPTHGTTYKLNLDASFIDPYSRPFGIGKKHAFGIGLCLTSDTGGCIGVRSLGRSARDAEREALAMLEAIKWAIKLELSPVIIESDSKKCVSFFMEDEDDDDDDDSNSAYWSSEALSLLSEAKLFLNSSELDISFQYCSRSCNNVADIAAKLGMEEFWHCKEWAANSPGEMVRSLSKDLGNETYGREGS